MRLGDRPEGVEPPEPGFRRVPHGPRGYGRGAMGLPPPAAGPHRVEKRTSDGSVAARWPARVFAGGGV